MAMASLKVFPPGITTFMSKPDPHASQAMPCVFLIKDWAAVSGLSKVLIPTRSLQLFRHSRCLDRVISGAVWALPALMLVAWEATLCMYCRRQRDESNLT